MARYGGVVAMGSAVDSPNPDGNMRPQRSSSIFNRTDHGLSPRSQGAVRRVEKIGNAHVFAASVTRETAERRIVADYLRFFDGRVWPFLEHSIALARMTKEDLTGAERYMRDVAQCGGIRG